MHTVLVLGGYGFFGSRIASSLVSDPSIRLLVGGRRIDRAVALCESLGLGAEHAIEIDARAPGLDSQLSRHRVDTLIHTAGPFQAQDYAVPRAAIAARCNYVDLADGRDFVVGIGALNDSAVAANVAVVSGASSVPALSSAVVDRDLHRFSRLDAIRIGISSGGRAPGIATVKGIFGYCGKPI